MTGIKTSGGDTARGQFDIKKLHKSANYATVHHAVGLTQDARKLLLSVMSRTPQGAI